jgi:Tol biopolymer transport system component
LLTNDEAYDAPTAWTTDSKAVLFLSDRNGSWGVFRQRIGEETAEPIVTGLQFQSIARLSADGDWILYLDRVQTADPSTLLRLMRIPVSGGVPQPVLEARNFWDFACARAPASLCVVLEESQDEKQFTLTAFDPLKGRGKVLRTIQKDTTAYPVPAGLSPDGSTFAISKSREGEIHVRLLSLSGGSDREVTVKGWSGLAFRDLKWSADGKGLYCGAWSTAGSPLLYIDLKGNARVLWQYKGPGMIWGVPSPDGRHLAMRGAAITSNVWMLEGF